MRVIGLILALFLSLLVSAQHSGLNLGDLNHNIYQNPALTGSYGFLNASLSIRNDWILDENHPKSQIMSIHSPLKKEDWSIGTQIGNDIFGDLRNTSFLVFTSYKMTTSKGILSFGVNTGINFSKIRNDEFLLIDENDQVFERNFKSQTLNLGLGIHIQNETYYFGVSLPQMNNTVSSNFFHIGDRKNLQKILLAGYNYTISDRLKLENHLIIKQLGKGKLLGQYIPLLVLDKIYSGGIILKGAKSLGLLFRYQLNEKIKLGYNFDYSLSKIAPRNAGNHELMLSYSFVEIVNSFNPKLF